MSDLKLSAPGRRRVDTAAGYRRPRDHQRAGMRLSHSPAVLSGYVKVATMSTGLLPGLVNFRISIRA